MIGDARPIRLTVRAESGTALSAEAVSMGLIVTELVINALKHAFTQEIASPEIVVAYDVNASGWRLSVSDNGSGRKPRLDDVKPGLGTSLIDALSHQLGARVSVESGAQGTRVSVTHSIFTSQLPDAA
jgi:two-component sensor histidine kinase